MLRGRLASSAAAAVALLAPATCGAVSMCATLPNDAKTKQIKSGRSHALKAASATAAVSAGASAFLVTNAAPASAGVAAGIARVSCARALSASTSIVLKWLPTHARPTPHAGQKSLPVPLAIASTSATEAIYSAAREAQPHVKAMLFVVGSILQPVRVSTRSVRSMRCRIVPSPPAERLKAAPRRRCANDARRWSASDDAWRRRWRFSGSHTSGQAPTRYSTSVL